MPSNPSGPIRRAQLIAPFGTGAMVVVPGGVSLMIAGLDYWYQRLGAMADEIDLAEYQVYEWRLQSLLGVSHFRLPPDFRRFRRGAERAKNVALTVPAYRFPAWHFCSECKLLMEQPLVARGRIECLECKSKGKRRYMYQVPIIAVCENGHAQDFPWREWVHRTAAPPDHGPLRLEAKGSATLAGQVVRCDGCDNWRTLASVTTASEGTSQLSKTLSTEGDFLCRGHMPWLGPGASEPCNGQLRGSLRSASNVYYAQVRSAIYLPRLENTELQEIEALLQNQKIQDMARLLLDLGAGDSGLVAGLRNAAGTVLGKYTDNQIAQAVRGMFAPTQAPAGAPAAEPSPDEPADWFTAFRREEFNVLREARDEPLLKIRRAKLADYDQFIVSGLSRIMLVDKLRETRALAGFTRVYAESQVALDQLGRMLWRTPPTGAKSWLPAYAVFGEGIFLELDEARLQEWEQRKDVQRRCGPLIKRYSDLLAARRAGTRPVGPRFILLHTLAHLIMNRLTFECGYSSASLRERLFVSTSPTAPMAGFLVYTAAGDSDGTMGGLVRMGRPGNLEPVIRRAVEGASWCSADPVCMEMGRANGQGPDSCNLAACHSCALVPETACEEFNRFLDRALVVGEAQNPNLGFINFVREAQPA